jgi:hypothetical protein
VKGLIVERVEALERGEHQQIDDESRGADDAEFYELANAAATGERRNAVKQPSTNLQRGR